MFIKKNNLSFNIGKWFDQVSIDLGQDAYTAFNT